MHRDDRVRGGTRAGRGLRWALLLGMSSAQAMAAEVYQTIGEHGEASYTDEVVAGAEPVELDVPQAPAGAAAEARRRVEQTLEVARELEQSRLAREAASAQTRASRTVSAPAPAAQPEPAAGYPYAYPYPFRYGAAPDRRHRDGRGQRRGEPPGSDERGERTISKPMLWSADETER